MRNQTTKSHNAKSKILLITLCIFGLLFSYSCQCKNNVSDPNNIPDDNGLNGGGGGGGQTDTGGSGSTDPDKDLVDGDLSTTSTKLIRVSGDTVKISATIKFKNATATLKSFEDTDSTSLKDGDIVYEGTTLTLKADTTDASKIDTTVGGKITWEKASKKITATFTLKPAENVTLSETEKTVVIEIYKEKLVNPKEHIGEIIKQASGFSPLQFGFSVNFNGTPNDTDITATLKALDAGKNQSEIKYSKDTFIESLKTNIQNEANSGTKKITYTNMELVNHGAGATAGIWSFTFKFTFSDTDYDLTDEQKINGIEYRVDVQVGSQSSQIDGSWVVFE
ncbi:hypothetical protein [Brachyspira catarrhinii]|uniref:Uncharacterized protein n=1 Tax=Brachyspira catarrhinii TaxID=2528966 RepID=A0ABY2TMN6_9SPIR|nr:hypothetical protein [Brachyspira catarrhinii]TKZ25902.1 hypothetical protein EZH24_12355 [Brachyspira catarrhinii]